MTADDWVRQAASTLEAAGFDSSRIEAQLLAAHTLGVDRTWLLVHGGEPFPELAGEALLARRLRHEPLAYILGWREFYGRRFAVRKGVLVPRQETETVVELALRHARPGAKVLDLGTGSGCIAVTLKLERPDLRVVALDKEESALEIARENAEALGAEIDFQRGDFLTMEPEERFDLVVSNPPYIGIHERLPRDVADFEPAAALYSGETGMEFYEAIARNGRSWLTPRGTVVLEAGDRQASEIRETFADWEFLEAYPDLMGIERALAFRA